MKYFLSLIRACTHLEIVARDHNKIEIAAREGVIAKAMATTSNNEIDFIAIPQQIFQMSTRPIITGILSFNLAVAADDFSQEVIKTKSLGGSIYLLEGAGGNMTASIGPDGVLLVDDDFAEMAGLGLTVKLRGYGWAVSPTI